MVFVKKLRVSRVFSLSNQKCITAILCLRRAYLLGFLLFSRLYCWFCCHKVLWYMGTAIHKLINNNAWLTTGTRTSLQHLFPSVHFQHPPFIISDAVLIKWQILRGRWLSRVMTRPPVYQHFILEFQSDYHLNLYSKKERTDVIAKKQMLTALSIAAVTLIRQTKFIPFHSHNLIHNLLYYIL